MCLLLCLWLLSVVSIECAIGEKWLFLVRLSRKPMHYWKDRINLHEDISIFRICRKICKIGCPVFDSRTALAVVSKWQPTVTVDNTNWAVYHPSLKFWCTSVNSSRVTSMKVYIQEFNLFRTWMALTELATSYRINESLKSPVFGQVSSSCHLYKPQSILVFA